MRSVATEDILASDIGRKKIVVQLKVSFQQGGEVEGGCVVDT